MDGELYDELFHHGILGQKWGVRRYQNADGSLTAAGRAHYGYGDGNLTRSKVVKAVTKTASTVSEVTKKNLPKASNSWTEKAKDKSKTKVKTATDELNEKVASTAKNAASKLKTKYSGSIGGTEEISKTKKVLDASSDTANKATNVLSNAHNTKADKNKVDVSEMSNQELQEMVTRMNLEQQYTNLNRAQTSEGMQFTTNLLKTAGSVLAVTSSALGIALAIKQLKGK